MEKRVPQWGSPLESWARDMRFSVKSGSKFNMLSLKGGRYCIDYEHYDAFFDRLIDGERLGIANFIVECRPADKSMPYRLIVDFDADSQTLDEVSDAEWRPLLNCFFGVLSELFDVAELTAVICKADTKLRSKDGQPVRKSGIHVILPEFYVTDVEALAIRDVCIRRIREYNILEFCPILREQRLEDLLDDSIYDANGFRLPLNHKATSCSDCARKRRAANHEAQRTSTSSEPHKDVFHRYDSCKRCFGSGYIYEGRPYKPAHVLVWNTAMREAGNNTLLLQRLQEDLKFMYQNLCVCVWPRVEKTPLRAGVVLPVIKTRGASKRIGGPVDAAAANSAKAPKKGVVNAVGGGGQWTFLARNSSGYDELDRFIFERFRHPLFDADPRRKDPQIVLPHGIADLKRSPDGLCLIANSISCDCSNKLAECMRSIPRRPEFSEHSRSRVYFVITRSRDVGDYGIYDAHITQRCHCQKTFNGVSCKEYRSRRVSLPFELVTKLWPRREDDVAHAALLTDHADEIDAAIIAACDQAEVDHRRDAARRAETSTITDKQVLRNIPALRDISLLHLLIQGRASFFADFDLMLRGGAGNGAGEAVEARPMLIEAAELSEADEAAAMGRALGC
jgi:hypothetical protein